MKSHKKIKVAVLVAVAIAATTTGIIFNRKRSIMTTNIEKRGSSQVLMTNGNKLVTPSGEQILLRGTNLGGWLVQESWMCPINKEDKEWGAWDTRQAFQKRGFSEEQILKLMETYETNWITAEDLDNIKALGLNCVRVPFWYGNFQKDDRGTYYFENDIDKNPGFQRLDWVIKECGKRGIYVILDMHGAPGFQNDDHSSGKPKSSQLFDDTEEGKYYRALTVELWQRIAKRYKGNPVVAAYDLLNEPMNGFEGSEKNDSVLWDFYDVLYKAIRKVDPDHIISMEGIWEIYNLPKPQSYNWSNVLYQTHNYNWKKEEIDQKIKDAESRLDWNVPLYVGEFQSEGIWDYALDSYNKNNISWTTWTYKGVKSTLTGWFLHRSLTAPLVSPETDSYDVILQKWSKVSTTEKGFQQDEFLAKKLKEHSL